MKLLRKGKVKDVYDLEDGRLLFKFSDRVSAFDLVLPDKIPFKGEVLCRFSEYYFETLGFPNHMLEVTGSNEMVVKKLDLIPIECVVRGYLYGSLYERVKTGQVDVGTKVLAERLERPYFDPTTKFEEKDRPVRRGEIIDKGWLSEGELQRIMEHSIVLYEKISEAAREADFILADIKLEFGREEGEGEILLADSIGPDEFRLWPLRDYQPGRVQESFDKQVIRDWLIRRGYKKRLDDARARGEVTPPPPRLPESLIQETSRRYIYAYENLTKRKFR